MTLHLALDHILKERLHVTPLQIAEFCDRWHILEFGLFGSVLRDDFQPETSDVDVLVVFKPEAHRGLTEWLTMQEELEALFQRKVDLVSKSAIEQSRNPIRKRNVLQGAQVIYDSQP